MTGIFSQLNLAQWFMIVQIITCILGGIGFWIAKMPYTGTIWVMYSLANVGWFMVASGYK
jgi:energy-converting hydrogenase Eha subunit C